MNAMEKAQQKIDEVQADLDEMSTRITELRGKISDRSRVVANARLELKNIKIQKALGREAPEKGPLLHAINEGESLLQSANEDLKVLLEAQSFQKDVVKAAEQARSNVQASWRQQYRAEFDKRLGTLQRDVARLLVCLERGHFPDGMSVEPDVMLLQILGMKSSSKLVFFDQMGAVGNQMADAEAFWTNKEAGWDESE